MRNHIIGGLAVILAAAAAPSSASAATVTVNCSNPADSISLKLRLGFDDIRVQGTCTETVNIRRDDITIQGIGAAKLLGKVIVDGAARVKIKNLKVQGSPDTGILLMRGASVLLNQVTVNGAGQDGIKATGNSYLELVGSVVENSQVSGVFIVQGSSASVVGSTIRNNAADGLSLQNTSTAEVLTSTFEGNGPQGDSQVFIGESSSVRLTGNTIAAVEPAEALTVTRGAVARLAGQNTISGEGFATIDLDLNATLIQRGGVDTITGPLQIRDSSSAEIRSIELNGDINIENHSMAVLHDGHISGGIGLVRDSGLSIVGGSVDGNVECADEESSFFTELDPSPIGGDVNCSGF
ncbi:MAG TPA: right-handed parallel beta-helix repeat-containing protein [Dongiaceae bacterium]